jgi:LCP family protein required for cell wall assembly
MRTKFKVLIAIVLVLALGTWLGFRFLTRTNQIFTGKNGNLFTRVTGLFVSPDKELIGEQVGIVNILLMGVGGNGHDGAYLTDTMIVASINLKSSEVTLISIPRDFAITLPKYGYNKINAAYAYAYRDDPDTAGEIAMETAEKITGFKIPYYAVVDFAGFVKAVDHLGGVDVQVERTFTDATFPNDYPKDTRGFLSPVTFTKGLQHMNGRSALIFARSRHSPDNNEGSDFARSERQKKILVAVKDKILALKLTGLSTINNLLKDFTENFRTNLEPHEMKRLADLAQKIDSQNIYSFSLEPQDSLICSALVDPRTGVRIPAPAAPTEPNASESVPEIIRMYVIQPCAGKTLIDVHEYLSLAPLLAKLKKEAAVIEVQNTTGKTGLAAKMFDGLIQNGLTINYATPKTKVMYEQTILYDNSKGRKPNTFEYLKNNYEFVTSDIGYPSSTADFVIILGRDAL